MVSTRSGLAFRTDYFHNTPTCHNSMHLNESVRHKTCGEPLRVRQAATVTHRVPVFDNSKRER